MNRGKIISITSSRIHRASQSISPGSMGASGATQDSSRTDPLIFIRRQLPPASDPDSPTQKILCSHASTPAIWQRCIRTFSRTLSDLAWQLEKWLEEKGL